MAGKKFGMVIGSKVPSSYFTLSEEEQARPGVAIEELMQKYGDKIDFVRRYWTRSFTAEVTDVFVIEADDLMDIHNFNEELMRELAKTGDPERYGTDVKIWTGVNPDAGS